MRAAAADVGRVLRFNIMIKKRVSYIASQDVGLFSAFKLVIAVISKNRVKKKSPAFKSGGCSWVW